MTKVEAELFDYDLGKDLNQIFNNNERFKLEPNMLDYMIGDPEKMEELSSVRFDAIKDMSNDYDKIDAMAKYLKDTIIKQDFPDELYVWLARDVLGMKFKKYEIEDMKRKYKIDKKRQLKDKKEEEKRKNKIEKQKKKCLTKNSKETILTF
jgi:hypothetical protein|tara:strand:- start:794 stop:1246 length:453 start_codon:yes stop_codon:yes gene_type:complete